MNASRRTFRAVVGIIAVIAIIGGAAEVDGQELRWQPISATGDFTITDNSATEGTPSRITLDAAGCQVTLELKVSGWGHAPGSPVLGAYTATLDSAASYNNWSGYPIGPYHPLTADGCFIDETRPDFVYFNLEPMPAVFFGTLDYEWGSTCQGGFPSDPGTIQYGGTLILDLPVWAKGTYEIQMNADTAKTFMNNEFAEPIPGVVRTPAQVTIDNIGPCCYGAGLSECADSLTLEECVALAGPGERYLYHAQSWRYCFEGCSHNCWNSVYNDGNACTNEWVDDGYDCVWHTERTYDTDTYCCDPSDGTLIAIDDGWQCTADLCDWATGEVTHEVLAAGTECDDSVPCSIDDACNGTGDPDACVGSLPEDLQIDCAIDEECPDGWFCETDPGEPMYGYCNCTFNTPVSAPPPFDAATNRYLSFSPLNHDHVVALDVTLASSTHFPGSTGVVGWVGDPQELAPGEHASAVVDAPVYRLWPEGVIHLTGCEIVTAAVYEIRSTTGTRFSDPLIIATVAEPAPKHWGDIVGDFTGDAWTAADGIVGMNDVMAAIQGFQHAPTAPVWTWLDVDGEEPNAIINMTDVMQIVFGFQGQPYPFSDPADCP